MTLHHFRRGAGKPLLLVHGLGSRSGAWSPVLEALCARREVVAVDLPGHGETPALPGPPRFADMVEAVQNFVASQGLVGVDAAGFSMGGRLVLELARRQKFGAVVALAPGGFWEGWERTYLHATLGAAIRLVRLAKPLLPAITANDLSRAVLFAQFSAHPSKLPPSLALDEAESYAACASFDPLLADLAGGPVQEGAARGEIQAPMALVWGRQDRVTLPAQAERAAQKFPDARLHWLDECGHYSLWDQPAETVRLIFETIAPEEARDGRRHLPAAGHA